MESCGAWSDNCINWWSLLCVVLSLVWVEKTELLEGKTSVVGSIIPDSCLHIMFSWTQKHFWSPNGKPSYTVLSPFSLPTSSISCNLDWTLSPFALSVNLLLTTPRICYCCNLVPEFWIFLSSRLMCSTSRVSRLSWVLTVTTLLHTLPLVTLWNDTSELCSSVPFLPFSSSGETREDSIIHGLPKMCLWQHFKWLQLLPFCQ